MVRMVCLWIMLCGSLVAVGQAVMDFSQPQKLSTQVNSEGEDLMPLLAPDGKTLFTANGSSNDVAVVDAGSMKLLGRIPVGDSPWGLVVLPTSGSK